MSDALHGSKENSHLQAEGAQTSRKCQMDFTEAARTATYDLRVRRQAENVRWTSRRQREQQRSGGGCADKQKLSDALHGSKENSHIQPEGAQTSRKCQEDFTEPSRTATYVLRVSRQAENVRWTSRKHREQPLTR